MSFGNIQNFQQLFEISKNVHVSKNIRKFILIFYDRFEKIEICFKSDAALCFYISALAIGQ